MKATVCESSAGERLDVFIANEANISRSFAAKLAEDNRVYINGIPRKKNYLLRAGDSVEFNVPEPSPPDILPENLPLDIVYEDGDIIVVNKARGMSVHPSEGEYTGTLVNALLHHCGTGLSGINGVTRPGIVHRLDRDTSGLIVAAKNDSAHNSLAEQIRERTAKRVYTALAYGNIEEDSGVYNLPIGRSRKDFRKMAVYNEADESRSIREATTNWRVLGRYSYRSQSFTLLECSLVTGRTHQIRVHLAYSGHPIVGDRTYGNYRANSAFPFMHAQCLTARRLSFIHPRTNGQLAFEIPLPADFSRVMRILGEE